MKRFTINTSVAVILGLGIALILLWVLGGESTRTIAAPAVLSQVEGPRAEGHIEAPSAPTAELHVCFGGCLYSSIQDAVDAANDGDVIKVAVGTYTGVQGRPAPAGYAGPSVITQAVYISKTVTIRGGYTTTNWTASDPETNPTILDAQGQGRVLYITGDISPAIEGLRITGGDSAELGGGQWNGEAGGGVYVITATVTLSGCRVVANTANRFVPYGGNGGGVHLRNSSNATLIGNIIRGNDAESGGGVYLRGSNNAILIGNTIQGNAASGWYGGAWGGGISLGNSPDATLIDNIIQGNSAQHGGGVCLWGSDNVTLSGNIILSNTARARLGGEGGGVLLWDSGNGTLSGNIIRGNFGGGVFMWDSDNTTLDNNVIADNQSWGDGSEICVAGSTAYLRHTTLVRNGGGSGLYVTDSWYGSNSIVALTNTVLVGHSVGIYVGSGNTATLESTLWNNNTTNWSGEGTVKHSNDYAGNPAFVDPDNGDYHITSSSVAIDAGVDAGVDHDIDGEPRPLGSGYDLGADEIGLFATKQATPDPVEPGASLTYTIRITNVTDVELHATITDTLPEHITLGKTSAGTLILPGGVVIWTPVSIAPQGVWTETVVVTVEADYAGPLVNVIEVTTEEGVIGRYVHTLAPDMEVTKQAHADTVYAGEQLTYTITVTNTGNFDLHATITDTLPAHVTTGGTAGGTTVLPGGKLVWTPVITAPSGVWMETVVVTIEHDYAGPLTNLVEVTTKEGAAGDDSVTVNTGWYIYLPLVMRSFP